MIPQSLRRSWGTLAFLGAIPAVQATAFVNVRQEEFLLIVATAGGIAIGLWIALAWDFCVRVSEEGVARPFRPMIRWRDVESIREWRGRLVIRSSSHEVTVPLWPFRDKEELGRFVLDRLHAAGRGYLLKQRTANSDSP